MPGAFENFPYSNFHEMNMDWLIKIAKDFLDQYTHIQEVIANGEDSLENLTESGLDQLQDKADTLEGLLQEWYNTHSEDIADQLSDALIDLNAWYALHSNYLDETLTTNINTFSNRANEIAQNVIETIPEDYSDLSNTVYWLERYHTNDENSIRGLSRDENQVKTFTLISPESTYSTESQLNSTYISNRKIRAGSLIKDISVKSGRDYESNIYIINATTHKVIYRKTFSATTGWNNVEINFVTPVDAYIAVRTMLLIYTSTNDAYFTYAFNDGKGLWEATSTQIYDIGDTINYNSIAPTTYFCLAFTATITGRELKEDIALNNLKKNNILIPRLMDHSVYTKNADAVKWFISNRPIPANALVTTVDVVVHTTGTMNLCLIDNTNTIVKLYIDVPVESGTVNHININYYTEQELRIGFVGTTVFTDTDSGLNKDNCFNIGFGLYEAPINATNVRIGAVLNITKSSNGKFGFDFQTHYITYPSPEETVENALNEVFNNTKHTNWLPEKLQTTGVNLRYISAPGKFALIGRWYQQNVNGVLCYCTNNCGSEIHLMVEGATTITVLFEDHSSTEAYYAYTIDNSQPTRKSILNNSFTLPNTNKHYVRIITDGITEQIGKWQYGNGFAFSDITVNSGTISAVIPQNPLITFYGDSLTEGIRALGIEDSDMGEVNSATGAFPWFCCEKLHAVPHRAGYGAVGFNHAGSFNTPENILNFLYKEYAVYDYFPDAIVINFGTNDTDMDSTSYVNAYNSLLQKIYIKYPGIKVFLMIPFSQAHAQDIRTVHNSNPNTSIIETANWQGITYTDGIHLTKAGAEIAGNYLADAMLNEIY